MMTSVRRSSDERDAMTYRELYLLRPWINAGLGVVVDQQPSPELVTKRYLEQVEGGYALTERGERFATTLEEREQANLERRVARPIRNREGRQPSNRLHSPEGDAGDV